jgi:hypothetical protein
VNDQRLEGLGIADCQAFRAEVAATPERALLPGGTGTFFHAVPFQCIISGRGLVSLL